MSKIRKKKIINLIQKAFKKRNFKKINSNKAVKIHRKISKLIKAILLI
jgi:hypothetical protein